MILIRRTTTLLAITLFALSAGATPEDPHKAFIDLSLPLPGRTSTSGAERSATLTAVVFLNFDGATIVKAQGSDSHNNISFLCGGDIPAFSHEPFDSDRQPVIDQVANRVKALFADFALDVVTERPPSPAYDMVVIGGSPAICGYAAGYAGMSHLDCDNASSGDIAFVFSEGITSLDMLAVVIAHEVAHGYGLPHSDEGCDVMSNFICSDSNKRFLDKDMGVTPDHLGKCGLVSTNSWRMLYDLLGASRVPLRVQWPQDDKLPLPPRVLHIAGDSVDGVDDDSGDDTSGDTGGCTVWLIPAGRVGGHWSALFVLAVFLLILTVRRRSKN